MVAVVAVASKIIAEPVAADTLATTIADRMAVDSGTATTTNCWRTAVANRVSTHSTEVVVHWQVHHPRTCSQN